LVLVKGRWRSVAGKVWWLTGHVSETVVYPSTGSRPT